MDAIAIESGNSTLEVQNSGLELDDDVKVKIESDHTIKSEPVESEELTNVDNSDSDSLDFEREIPTFLVKLEADEFVTKQETDIFASAEQEKIECSTCGKTFKYKRCLEQHQVVHKEPSEIEIFHCELCGRRCKRKGDLQKHIKLQHKKDLTASAPADQKRVECGACDKTFKDKGCLRRHQLVHKDPSTLKLWRCSQCNYETKWKNNFKNHLITHKNPRELQMFHCATCSYSTKHKGDLTKHIQRHHSKDRSKSVPVEQKSIECGTCGKTFTDKKYLKNHQSVHSDPSTLKLWKCSQCNYETKWKHRFNGHLLTHKNPSEIEMFRCARCSYSTKYKNNLVKHMLRHDKDLSKRIECEVCGKTFKTESILDRHQTLHKDPSTPRLWKCNQCNYKATYRCYLKRHLFVHKDPSEVDMFCCDSCGYRSKRKYELDRHIKRRHRDAGAISTSNNLELNDDFKVKIEFDDTIKSEPVESEVLRNAVYSEDPDTLDFKREITEFPVKLEDDEFIIKQETDDVTPVSTQGQSFEDESYLKSHQLVHSDPSTVNLWKCGECNYETKWKDNFKDHLLSHIKYVGD